MESQDVSATTADKPKRQKGRPQRLTKKVVDHLPPEDRRFTVWDTDLPAFGVEVMPSGTKSYRLMYRRDGRLRKLTLGQHGAITAEEARALAKVALGDVARGGDPHRDKTAARKAMRLDEAFEQWLERHVEAKRKPVTQASYKQHWRKHIKPKLGSKRLIDIERADVAALHRTLRRAPYVANRAVAVLRSFFTWCERQGLRPLNTNPARLIEGYRETRRERLISPEELARLGQALKTAEARREWPWAIAAILLLLFTGARRGEILGLRWDQIDIDAGTARLADSKTGAKTLYLSAPARAVLARVPRQKDNPHVICGRRRGGPLIGLPHVWERIRADAGLGDLRLHDLRHAFASSAAMGGMPLLTIGRLLGHSQPAVTDRYAHFASSPLVSAANHVAAGIAAHLDGDTGANIVALVARRED